MRGRRSRSDPSRARGGRRAYGRALFRPPVRPGASGRADGSPARPDSSGPPADRATPEPPLRHGRRVGRMVASLAREAGLDPGRARRYGRAARFHDVGKVAVPDHILAKETPLSPAEHQVLRLHPAFGERLLSRWDSKAAEVARRVARSHHERWDGSGYPDGLARRDIPAAARLTAVADALDAMIEGRPYAGPRTASEALEELKSGAGGQFDPEVVALLADDPGAVLRARVREEG